jgi:hypothetical protein
MLHLSWEQSLVVDILVYVQGPLLIMSINTVPGPEGAAASREPLRRHTGDRLGLLNKKLLRDMRAHKIQVLAVVVIVMLGTIIFTTLLVVPRSLNNKLQHIFVRTDHEDFKVQVSGAPTATAASLSRPGNVTAVQGTIEREMSGTVRGSLAVVPVSIALGWALCWFLMTKVLSTSTTQLVPEMHLAAPTVMGICAVFVAVTALSVLPAARHFSKMDLATAVRERTG